MSTRQTLRDFLTSIRSPATSISLPVEPGSDGAVDEGDDLGIEPSTGRELLDARTGKSLLGDYTSHITQKNDFPLAPGVHESVSSIRGAALAPAETSSAGEVFADSRIGLNAEMLNRSNSMQYDSAGYPLSDVVDKLGSGVAADGNTLLSATVSAAASSDTASGQTKAVIGSFATFKKYNRFSPTSSPSSLAQDDFGNNIDPVTFESTRQMRFQTGKGEYDVEISEIAAEIDQDELAKIARSMLVKAAGWDDTQVPGDAKDPDQALDAISSATLTRFPEFVRDNLGVVDAFRAQDSYGFPANPDGSSVLSGRGDVLNKDYDEAVYTRTRGNTHAPNAPFGENPSNSNRVQSLQAGLSMIGLATLIDKKLIDIEGYVKELQVTNDTVLRGPYYLGISTKSDLSAKTRALVRTFMFETGIYSYEKCVAEGLYACFGYTRSSDGEATADISSTRIAAKYGDLVKKIANDLDKDYFDSPMGLSQGFWRAVTESALLLIRRIRRSTQQVDGADYVSCLLDMKSSLVVKAMNVFGSIGYHRLTIQGLSTSEIEAGAQPQNPYDIDGYPNAPGTRQMKSRDGAMLNRQSLAWRNSALPSAFILPVEAMMSSLAADYLFDPVKGGNPIKGMLGSSLYDKTYVKATKNSNSIPSIAAKVLEDRLGAEYLPFYFRDLRTNEVIAFHGFLDSLTDGFTANFNDSKGFGRADAVKNYSNTSRGINFSFTLAATSKEDFDEMWFKINKLVTLVYPQYTRGRPVTIQDELTVPRVKGQKIIFEQPFSQLAGGTPVVRVRVGDLLKSNYTRANLNRLFGVGNDTFGATNEVFDKITYQSGWDIAKALSKGINKPIASTIVLAPFLLYAASPMELTRFADKVGVGNGSGLLSAGVQTAAETISSLLINGFVNPILFNDRSFVINKHRDNAAEWLFKDNALPEFLARSKPVLKARATPYTVTKEGRTSYLRLLRPVTVKYISNEQDRTGETYEVEINDPTVGKDRNGAKCRVSAADLYVDTGQIVDIAGFPGILLAVGIVTNPAGALSTAGESLARNGSDAAGNRTVPIDLPLADVLGSLGRTFTSPENNSITRAFEDRMGEGLAGVIKSMTFAWQDANWEQDWNSRAPMSCKITVNFDPIHDIAPGLDSNGFNRAPVYNVGQIMHDSFGHPQADGGSRSQFFFKNGGAVAETALQPSARQEQVDFFDKRPKQ